MGRENKVFLLMINDIEQPAYTSKDNYKRKKQVILLMITDDDDNRWHYLAVKSCCRFDDTRNRHYFIGGRIVLQSFPKI